jgi:AAA domain
MSRYRYSNGPSGEEIRRAAKSVRVSDVLKDGFELPSNGAASSNGKATRSMPMTLTELLSRQEEPYDWLIDGLLEREDRFILTGNEGEGKSTLLRQMGIAAAAGLHPFTFEPLAEPVTVLDIDCENSPRQLGREFAKQLLPLGLYPPADLTNRFYIETCTGGLALDDVRDPEGDRARVESMIADCRPGLVIIGPMYKLFGGDAQDETPGRTLSLYFDHIRTKYHFPILIEAHSPHGEKRPYGWSGWKRWPEFGLHLDQSGKMTRWRGDRDVRAWPELLARGNPDGWLWTPTASTAPESRADPHEKQITDAQLEVLAAMRRADKTLTWGEVVERVSRRKAIVLVAFNRLRDQGAFIVTQERRSMEDGRQRLFDTFLIDPKGPYAPTK